jgi:anti-anti-sigma regulatory factor
MLRITFTPSPRGPAVVRVAGRLAGASVGELCRECDRLLAHGQSFVLDLAELGFLDASGVALLRSLQRRQVTLQDPNPFVAEALKGDFHGAER